MSTARVTDEAKVISDSKKIIEIDNDLPETKDDSPSRFIFFNVSNEFLKLIDLIRNDGCVSVNDKATVIKITKENKTDYYGFLNQPFNGGSYCLAYKAYLLNEDTGASNRHNLIVVKKIPAKKFKRTEVRNLKYLYGDLRYIDKKDENCDGIKSFFGSAYVEANDFHYILMPFYPGDSILNRPLVGFDFLKRINVIIQILLALNHAHYQKPWRESSDVSELKGDAKPSLDEKAVEGLRPAIVHHDIAEQNILVHDSGLARNIEVNLIDWGLSETDPALEEETWGGGAKKYIPLNVMLETGTAEDIYALTPIFADILGATDPFALKDKKCGGGFVLEGKYDFTGVLGDKSFAPPHPRLRTVILDLLNRMQDEKPSLRPDVNELLRFFISVTNCCKHYKSAWKVCCFYKSVGVIDAEVELCKLILISKNLWYTNLIENEEEALLFLPALRQFDKFEYPITFDHYDFAQHRVAAQALVFASQQSDLTPDMVKQIMLLPVTAKTILESKSLNSLYLDLITKSFEEAQEPQSELKAP